MPSESKDKGAKAEMETLRAIAQANEPEHITYGDVFDDLGFSPKKAAAMKLKAQLHEKIVKCATHYSRTELQAILREPQSRVSDLMRGKIAKFSLDMLVFYAEQLGMRAEIKTTQTRRPVHPNLVAATVR